MDTTHNPEFTTCEFYRAFAGLEELIVTTEKLFESIDKMARTWISTSKPNLPAVDIEFAPGFGRLDFTLTVENCLGRSLPNLSAANAAEDLLAIFKEQNIGIPASPTLPRLLDKLSTEFIEPQCQAPTFIIHHPECLSPLAKSFTHDETGQRVAASAELFVKGHEIANMYEEENSPFEQRRKFEDALRFREDKADPDDTSSNIGINESYIQALEWGLPPIGGWGCGIDRLVMLFSGASRIGDVLTFGTLRNVVSLGTVTKPNQISDKVAKKTKQEEQRIESAEAQETLTRELIK